MKQRQQRVGSVGHEVPAVSADDGRLPDLSSITAEIDGRFLAGDDVARARSAPARGLLPQLGGTDRRIGAHVARLGKFACIGLNYRDHA
ncbi:hypothetical protein [Embleya scabrispora]|uniref:hypothetical protein n=1 Tax=Embleya scabrispora TaxID=159449 RepID=UPI00039FDE06|nr:hypothetical protein [Embleya scabrispora]MYS79267.1 hypothetical protein [Streptomyces sp. SID5474]